MQQFHERRRQQFLTEDQYTETVRVDNLVKDVRVIGLSESEEGHDGWHSRLLAGIASNELDFFLLHYTAGLPIEPMRYTFEEVVIAYERYAQKLREYEGDPDAMAFPIRSVDGYCPYIWLISLCYLLHRRDLLPRVAKLVDGENEENAGEDVLIEEMLSYDDQLERYETDVILGVKPFRPLFRAYCTKDDKGASLSKIDEFLKSWYKDLKAAPWHDTHKNDAGYYGYWAFEAAAAVLLLEIEDDSSLHQYLYYPKDLVKFAREFVVPANDISNTSVKKWRCEAGHACPKTGDWWSPANKMEKRHFAQGAVMPHVANNSWGATIWYMQE